MEVRVLNWKLVEEFMEGKEEEKVEDEEEEEEEEAEEDSSWKEKEFHGDDFMEISPNISKAALFISYCFTD